MGHYTYLKQLKRYLGKSGRVYILGEKDGSKTVAIYRYIDGMKSRHRINTYNFNDMELALAKFEELVSELSGRGAVKCIAGVQSHKCAPDKCPLELGGADYWRLFRGVCLYRSQQKIKG